LYYTASGIIICIITCDETHDDEHIELETCRGIKETYYKKSFCALSWLITEIMLRCTVSKTSNTLGCPAECFPSLLACRTAIRNAQFSSLEFPALDLAPKQTDAPASKLSKCVSSDL